jgi:hypothetical protein
LQFPPAPQLQAHLNLASKPTSSNKCMVTPQISGLMNGDALRALRAAGLECATGDNTWEHLKNQQHPYQMLYSNAVSDCDLSDERARKRSRCFKAPAASEQLERPHGLTWLTAEHLHLDVADSG